MRSVQEIHAGIIARPERDDLRREFGETIRSQNASWSRYIELGLETTSIATVPYERPRPSDELYEALAAPFRRFADNIRCEFYRGFVERIYVEPDVFIKHGEEMMSLAPIDKVVFFVGAPETFSNKLWREYLPELTRCPALARVRQLEFRGPCGLDYVAMQQLAQSPHLDSLITMSPWEVNHWSSGFPWEKDNEADENKMWELLFESPAFRRLIDWGLRTRDCDHSNSLYGANVTRLVTRRQLGDRKWGQPYGTSGMRWWYEPMSAESRALEQQYGYIPALHAGNWNATVLDVLRGDKPDFPAGATPTEEMYAVPPDEDRADSGW